MKQIYLDRKNDNELIGKTVKGFSLLNKSNNGAQFLMTFTDDTFVFLKIGEDDSDYGRLYFKNFTACPLSNYGGIPGYYDENNNKWVFPDWLQCQIDLGIIEPDEELMIKKYKEIKDYNEKQEYKRYLELKAKYENK